LIIIYFASFSFWHASGNNEMGETYQLLDSYKICNYSGGLGPKQRQGDFKSPEGFYTGEGRYCRGGGARC
jgi:murein L,D-transpeptidase YafK